MKGSLSDPETLIHHHHPWWRCILLSLFDTRFSSGPEHLTETMHEVVRRAGCTARGAAPSLALGHCPSVPWPRCLIRDVPSHVLGQANCPEDRQPGGKGHHEGVLGAIASDQSLNTCLNLKLNSWPFPGSGYLDLQSIKHKPRVLL